MILINNQYQNPIYLPKQQELFIYVRKSLLISGKYLFQNIHAFLMVGKNRVFIEITNQLKKKGYRNEQNGTC